MFTQLQTAFAVVAVAIGCTMLPVTGHDPSGGRLSGRNPLSAINDVVRSREQRKADAKCFVTLTHAALVAHRDGCEGRQPALI